MIITRLIPVLLLTAPSIALITPSPAHELRPATVQTATSSYSILGYDPITGEFGVASASEAPLIGMNLEFLDLEAGGVLVHGGPHLEISERVMAALEEELPPDRAIQVGSKTGIRRVIIKSVAPLGTCSARNRRIADVALL